MVSLSAEERKEWETSLLNRIDKEFDFAHGTVIIGPFPSHHISFDRYAVRLDYKDKGRDYCIGILETTAINTIKHLIKELPYILLLKDVELEEVGTTLSMVLELKVK
jgi:hypothetical protein